MIKIMSIAGARPNFMKLASIVRAIEKHNYRHEKNTSDEGRIPPIQHIIVHTGQHYDARMSHSFFEDLKIPRPDINLDAGSGSHAVQTAEIMKRFEPVLLQEQPDILLVVGDVNSTIACALVASKIQYPSPANHKQAARRPIIVHVEAGLRSFDRSMPEEINRILTDSLSDLLFITEESALNNLRQEGIPEEKIHFVGNVMIDTLKQHQQMADTSGIRQRLGLPSSYILVTLHRPSNVDQIQALQPLIACLKHTARQCHIVFPVHPRTKNSLKMFDLSQDLEQNRNITLTDPLGYLDFLHLIKNATAVVTDSGGIQEETTALKIPCVTLRKNTERPVTTTQGTNYLVGTDPELIVHTVSEILDGKGKPGTIPPLWDGLAGERIVSILVEHAVLRPCMP